jgi:3-hydroxyacyl-CoA dehydrogenase/3-hydroxy-2-methylbutyryl-CoA dehydrogenase
VIAINVVGTIDVVRQILPHIASAEADADGERGVIITVSSAAAFDGQPGQVAYSAAKGAIASLTLPLARDLARNGIRAVSISPGLFETNMTNTMPAKAKASLQKVLEFPNRAGRPNEFAGMVLHILSNSFLNGTVIRLDGATRMPSHL